MDRPFKVLFITAPIGSGHIRAAQAVSRVLRSKYRADVQIANAFDFFSPWLGKTILKVYLKVLAMFPRLYGRMYQWGNDGSLALVGRKIISCFLARRMKHFILECNPAGGCKYFAGETDTPRLQSNIFVSPVFPIAALLYEYLYFSAVPAIYY